MPQAPCIHCPFRRDQVSMTRPARKREIARALRRGGSFDCHETLDYDGDGEPRRTNATAFCAGALVTMENEGGAGCLANQMARIQARLRMFNPDKLRGSEARVRVAARVGRATE